MSVPSTLSLPGKKFQVFAWLLTSLLLVSAGCTVTLISAYDPEIDASATKLQKGMDTFLTLLDTQAGSPEARYEQRKAFYPQYLVNLRSVLLRAQSHPKNTLTEKQLTLMINNLTQLEFIHQTGPLDPAVISTMRDLFNQGWKAIMTLELAKKRGEES